MGDQVKILKGGMEVPVEPVGDLVTLGWLPGTWVKPSTLPPSISPGVLFTVERSDGTGHIAGFLKTGPQHLQPVQKLSDMWTTEQRQVPGGDTHADWSAFDAGGPLVLDGQRQLQRLGSRVVTLQVYDNSVCKFYVFETLSYSARHGGPGGPLVYAIGDMLYVSENGLLTKEQESPGHPYLHYVVVSVGSDFEGAYITFCSVV